MASLTSPLSINKRLEVCLNHYDTAYTRLARVRKSVQADKNHVHRFDRTLAFPEQYKNGLVRGLIHLARHIEDLAETCADLSSIAERLIRNLISSGNKKDMALIISSAAGRLVTGQLNSVGMAVHKAAGSGLYCLSSLLSLTALGLIQLGCGTRRPATEPSCLIKKSSIKHWATNMARPQSSVFQHMASKRKSHCNYMWNHLHQYGPVTRALMHLAFGIFQGVNKLLVSYDKHLGVAIGKHFMKNSTGKVLGCRLGLTLAVGSAAALSVPLSPFIIGLSTVGAISCCVALVLLILAKWNVSALHDWNGNIAKPKHHHVFGRVTPTCP